jgi:prepilin-type N-terminal cleavage/methylation domain-containing protein
MTAKLHERLSLDASRSTVVPHARGFSLIELMIAMVLGLLVIGSVGTVFLSAQQSYRIKADFEEAQDAFRFSSHVINRLVQSSESIIQPGSTGNELRIQLRGGPGIYDCTGAEIPDEADVVNNAIFRGMDGSLRCDPNAGGASTPVGVGVPLVSRVAAISFRYADLPDNEAPLHAAASACVDDCSDFKDPAVKSITWNDARSVRTTITMDTGLEVSFTSTSRGVSIGEPITIKPEEPATTEPEEPITTEPEEPVTT